MALSGGADETSRVADARGRVLLGGDYADLGRPDDALRELNLVSPCAPTKLRFFKVLAVGNLR
jgi:hypothetical protein